MKRFIALLLLVCCLLTACGEKPAAPEKLTVSLENGAAVISWAKNDEAETYRLYRRGQKDTDYQFIFDSGGDETAYLIRYATDAICWSQVPENLKDLSKQRRRWHIGLFQSMWKHRIMLANTKFGLTSFISYFYLLIYELLSPFIEIFGIATTILAFMVDLINVPFMLLFFGIYALFGSVIEKAPMGQDQAAKN